MCFLSVAVTLTVTLESFKEKSANLYFAKKMRHNPVAECAIRDRSISLHTVLARCPLGPYGLRPHEESNPPISLEFPVSRNPGQLTGHWSSGLDAGLSSLR
jgi:hypothetical protein